MDTGQHDDLDHRLRPLRPLDPGEEVMLHGEAANSATRKGINPYYGLVVRDHGWGVPDNDPDIWNVTVLWENGQELMYHRKDLWVIKDVLAIVMPTTGKPGASDAALQNLG